MLGEADAAEDAGLLGGPMAGVAADPLVPAQPVPLILNHSPESVPSERVPRWREKKSKKAICKQPASDDRLCLRHPRFPVRKIRVLFQ